VHIPDGLLSPPVIAATYLGFIAVLAYSLRNLKEFPEEKIPLLGLFAAGIFAAQMVNFPIIGGVSGHLLGGALVAVILGPHAAFIVMTTVLLIQTFFFGDGGITALGANILNMGAVGAYLGYYIYQKISKVKEELGIALAAWLSVVIGAALTAIEIGVSGNVPFTKVFSLMVAYHSIIGIGEALITLAVIKAVKGKVASIGGVPT